MSHENPGESVARWAAEAEAILIGAGSGLSAEAGFDYTDEAAFARSYPGLVKLGFRKKADLIGQVGLPPELEWGYYLANAQEVRFGPVPTGVYDRLHRLVAERDHFVLTTNADGLFVRSGFDPDRVFTPQGDYDRYQCLTPCTKETWPTAELIRNYLPLVDHETQALPKGRVPACPRCGGPVFLNVRGGDWFIEDPYVPASRRYQDWLVSVRNNRILLVEFWSGFSTAGWIRKPFERMARSWPEARMVRVNVHDSEVPPDLGARAFGWATRARTALDAWEAAVP